MKDSAMDTDQVRINAEIAALHTAYAKAVADAVIAESAVPGRDQKGP